MKKIRLLTPGPTAIPESVLAKFAEPIIHHRTSLFEAEFKILQDHLKWLFQTRGLVLTLTCTGTGAMEATVAGMFSPGDSVIVVNGGKFGERWAKISKTYGMNVDEILLERGKSLHLQDLESRILANPGAKAVLFQASETSTGALMPVKGIVDICKRHNLLSVCDGITAVGILNLPMDEWGIDVLITGSQKALMLPPGLSFLALSDRAWKAVESSRSPKYYFDLLRERKMQEKQQTAWTPGISLIHGGVESLGLLRKEGLQALFDRHEKLARCTRAAVIAMGLEFFSSAPSPVLTAVKVPSAFTVDQGKQIQKIMQEKYGVIITGGQDELQGKILRLSHFGYCDVFDVLTGVAALELALADLGYTVAFGAGTSAVLTAYRDS
ncbi:MAG: alanine--glyoxylate aminotransferase family protein [Bdellovibrionales bacterium]|nr:alanine--glyoxylate aminotransferase family protein [Bdellovibrionales bacterium]